MFVGHYGVSYAAKAQMLRVPLWVWFIAVQWLDVVWSVLVLLGNLRRLQGRYREAETCLLRARGLAEQARLPAWRQARVLNGLALIHKDTANYEEAAKAQHAVIWGLSTGIMREVVRTYRRERRDCSTHGHPNMMAAGVIMAAAPAISRERAREMVDQMLAWVIDRHGTWFWSGLQGDRIDVVCQVGERQVNRARDRGARSERDGTSERDSREDPAGTLGVS